ncbi:MAG: class I SAM-dependent methyltransferase [Planctomycetota bacterium]
MQARVGPETRVLDVGSGTGILSLFAAQAGAKVVHAAEASDMIHLAERIAEANGLADRIQFHKGPVEALELDGPVDLIISEWMGYFALAECMFESVLVARDKHLAPGGVMLPGAVEMWLAPVQDSRLDREHGFSFWDMPVYGFDFRELGDFERRDPLVTAPGVPVDALLGPPALLATLDCQNGTSESFWFESEVTLELPFHGTLHGLAGWFETILSPGIILSTAPGSPQTHWRQSFFPMREMEVAAGDRLEVRLSAQRRSFGDTRLPLYFLEARLMRGHHEVESLFYRYYGSFE